jgi:hypothetical protein
MSRIPIIRNLPPPLASARLPISETTKQELPQNLQNQLNELEKWAQANENDAKNDAIKFWMLKIPALVLSASAGITAYFKWDLVPVILSAIASLCVLIDGLNPNGLLRSAHHGAFLDIRSLQHRMLAQWQAGVDDASMLAQWQVGVVNAKNEWERNQLAAKIINKAQMKIAKIDGFIRKAETSIRDRPG